MLLPLLRASDDFLLQEMRSHVVKLCAVFESQIHGRHAPQMFEVQYVTKDPGLQVHLVPRVSLLADEHLQLHASDQLEVGIEVQREQLQWCAHQVDHVLQQVRDKSFLNRR